MKSEVHQEANKIWQSLVTGNAEHSIKKEVDTYRQHLNLFMPGDSYYYIFDVSKASFDFVSDEIEKVLGYDLAQVTVPFFIDKIHPEDQPWFLNFENKIMEFFKPLPQQQIANYKVRYDYRVRKKNGDYIRVLQQVITIEHNAENPVLKTFGVHTDISFLKPTGKPELSLIGLNGQPSYINVEVTEKFNTSAFG